MTPANGLAILPVEGVAEIRPGDDLVAEVVRCAGWLLDGDILIVTSKIISKAEGRLITVGTDDGQRDALRQQAITEETVRPVARRGSLRIVETRHGLVLAAAGVDASNVARDEIALLPLDPDASAQRLRDGLRAALGVTVAVVISDSLGRPWRHGITDVAIGTAGLTAVTDVRGQRDRHGNELIVTEVALADELAAAGDLVKGKLGDTPIAVVRGLQPIDDGQGSRRLLRGSGDDLFRLGTAEAIAQGRAEAGGDDASANVVQLNADTQATLASMPLAADPPQSAVREGFYALLGARIDATRRACVPGHITASTVVLDATGTQVLLTLHPRVGAWLQLGGHVEDDDESVLAAAAREAQEESGIAGITIDPVPIAVDIHPITCSLGLPTRHFDVQFLGRAPADASAVISSESLDLRWFDVAQLPAEAAPGVSQLVSRAVRRFGAGP